MDKDPFGYPITTYFWVIGLSAFAGMIRRLNSLSHASPFSLARVLIDGLSSGFSGLLTFWLCEWSGISELLSAFLIGVSGLMGARAWREFVEIFRLRLGLPAERPGGMPDFEDPPEAERQGREFTKRPFSNDSSYGRVGKQEDDQGEGS